MSIGKEINISDLYITQEHPPGTIIHRSNPDISSDDRSAVVAKYRKAQFAAILGSDPDFLATEVQANDAGALFAFPSRVDATPRDRDARKSAP